MNRRVLYAKEYDLLLPEKRLNQLGIDVVSVDKPGEALEEIAKNKDSFSAYVLGMLMIKDDSEVSTVDAVLKERKKLSLRRRTYPVDAELRNQHARRFLFDEMYSHLDNNGGFLVYSHLKIAGEFGKKPILWYTSQHDIHFAVQEKPENLVGVINIPEVPSKIVGWFEKNVQ